MFKIASAILVVMLAACAQTNYQQYEGRGPQIIEGQGGTKEVINGFDVWDNGTPPRRYQVLGVVVIEDSEGALANLRIRSALAEQIKAAGGNAAVAIDSFGGGQSVGMGFNSRGQMSTFVGMGRKTGRWQIVKYLDGKL